MPWRLGIDAGSKTIKLVILDENNTVLFSQYSLHRSDILTAMTTMFENVAQRFGNAEFSVCVTGSDGGQLAELLDVPYVQEVTACLHALEVLLPEADVAIELGGETAKVLFMHNDIEQRMNRTCAGGTGAFIDLMSSVLGLRARELNALAWGYQAIYPLAAHCAVFAQTDLRSLINEGVSKADIAASVFQAVATQIITELSCGRRIEGTVAFLGGPLEVYSALVQTFRRMLGLSNAQTLKPDDTHLFVAKGAALLGGQALSTSSEAALLTLDTLQQLLEHTPREEQGSMRRLPALLPTDRKRQAFKTRHAKHKVVRKDFQQHVGDVFLGIDAGSTTLKIAAIDRDGALLYSSYEKTRSKMLSSAQEALVGFYEAIPRKLDGDACVQIRHATVIGYGEQLLKAAFNVDSGEVETVAHLRAAVEFCPELELVLDTGGQNSTCMCARAGIISEISLSEACSSGCGVLIEGFSESLGYSKETFDGLALEAQHPVDLGMRCTVFMTSRVRHAQKEGIDHRDIAAGLAYSIARNALRRIIDCDNFGTDRRQLSSSLVVQGGTFMSDAVLRAFELEGNCEVIRPDIANLMGAYGAALIARERYEELEATVAEESFAVKKAQDTQIVHNGRMASSMCQETAHDSRKPLETKKLTGIGAGKQKAGRFLDDASTAGADDLCDDMALFTNAELFDANGSQETPLLLKARGKTSTLLIPFEIEAFRKQQSIQHCIGCVNNCLLTISSFSIAANSETHIFVTGNRCERGTLLAESSTTTHKKAAKSDNPTKLFNLIEQEQKLRANLKQRSAKKDRRSQADTVRPLVGIPVTLGLYATYPFWQAFFDRLGCSVLPPLRSDNTIYRRSTHRASENLCYPARLTHEVIAELIERGAEYVLLVTEPEMHVHPSKEAHFSPCPVFLYYDRSIIEDVTRLSKGAVTPLLVEMEHVSSLDDLAIVLENMFAASPLAAVTTLDLSRKVLITALKIAQRTQEAFNEQLWKAGEQALRSLERTGGTGIVLAGHPYHSDRRLNHSIDSLLVSLGFPVFSVASLARAAGVVDASYQQTLYEVARFVAQRPQLELVQLHSFDCNMASNDRVRTLIEEAGKIYTELTLNERVDLTAIRIRLRSLAFALRQQEKEQKVLPPLPITV